MRLFHRGGQVPALLLLCAAATARWCPSLAADSDPSPAPDKPAAVSAVRPVSDEDAASLRRSADSYSGCVVTVDAYIEGGDEKPGHRRGAGVLATINGFVFTPAFVVAGADALIVSFGSDMRAPAHVIAKDVESRLAILKVNFTPKDANCPALAGADAEKKDAPVVMLSPDRKGEKPVIGSVSACGKSVGPLSDVMEVVTQDTPDPVGGVLLSARGELVGIALGTMMDESGGKKQAKIYVLPSSKIKQAIDRIAAGKPGTEKPKVAKLEAT